MKHLPARVVMDARHYHGVGVTVAELARLYGVRRDTLSRAVNGATHAALVVPDGFRPRPLPVREPEPPHKRHVSTPMSPEDIQRLKDSWKPKPPTPASERVNPNPPSPAESAKQLEDWKEGQRRDVVEAAALKLVRLRAQQPRYHRVFPPTNGGF